MMDVVIPFAVNRTRFQSVSKEMIEFGDKVVIDYTGKEALSAGVERIGMKINKK